MAKCARKKSENETTTVMPKPKTKLLDFVLYTYIISALIVNVIALFQHLPANIYNSPYSCYILSWISVLSLGTGKASVQFSYFLRLDASYKDTTFQLNPLFLKSVYVALTVYLFQWVVFMAFNDKDADVWNYEYNFCQNVGSDIIIGVLYPAILILFELIMSILALVLFMKPLCRLKQIENDRYLHNLMVKVGLLNGIMIISSILAIFLSVFAQSIITFTVDNVINSFCLILMGRIHEPLYEKVCDCCISGKWCKYVESVDNMSPSTNGTRVIISGAPQCIVDGSHASGTSMEATNTTSEIAISQQVSSTSNTAVIH